MCIFSYLEEINEAFPLIGSDQLWRFCYIWTCILMFLYKYYNVPILYYSLPFYIIYTISCIVLCYTIIWYVIIYVILYYVVIHYGAIYYIIVHLILNHYNIKYYNCILYYTQWFYISYNVMSFNIALWLLCYLLHC